jgi:putative NADH-flavin reductase
MRASVHQVFTQHQCVQLQARAFHSVLDILFLFVLSVRIFLGFSRNTPTKMKIFLLIILFAMLTNKSLADTQSDQACDENMNITTTLVVGATGATGRHVVQMLLDRGHKVRTVVRSKERMEGLLKGDFGDRLEVTEAVLLDLDQSKLEELTSGCDAVVSCLGHTMDLKGIYGKPRKLVTEAVKRLTTAIGSQKTKFVLMGSGGVANPNGKDNIRPFFERFVITLLRYLVPPVEDNEQAALCLHNLGGSTGVEWTVVRPGNLIDGEVSKYHLLTEPHFGLFSGADIATRANVAHSMVELILNDDEWQKWKYQMPALNNIVDEE